MKPFKNLKTIVPIATIVLFGLFAMQPFYKESMPALHIDLSNTGKESETMDDEGWNFIRYKFIFPLDPKPDLPSEDLAKQEDLLAYYGE
jgi:hypothetical protein